MKDFTFWKEYEGASEGSGRSEKIWLMNPDTEQIGLFKFRKDATTTDHVSECIAYHLASRLEIPCAKFDIGLYNGREGSMSYNIVEREGMALIEGIYCINLKYKNYDAEQLTDLETQEKYSIEMIKNVLETQGHFEKFLNVLVFDFLIGNTDRHQSNWALILENGKLNFSPLYDNSSSLCAYVKEERIDQYLGNDKLLWKSLVDTKSKSLIRIMANDKTQPTHLKVLKFLRMKYYNETISLVRKIEDNVTKMSVCDILNMYDEVLSDKKKELIMRYLLEKVQMITQVYEEEVWDVS